MNLAAHLCGEHANSILTGDATFVKVLSSYGFQRVQINATAVNGVDLSLLSNNFKAANNIAHAALKFPSIEFIIQKNEETRPLWEALTLACDRERASFPKNITMLLDESKGTGKQMKIGHLQHPLLNFEVGYAGGIGPSNINEILQRVLGVAKERAVWIDMESSLRSIKNDQDVFDLDKCYSCISSVCALGLYHHPKYLVTN
jgi:phosphoribosylanthranilate isomerase